MNTPLITIGITYYNAADSIPEAVCSALDQTWKNIEIIIVNDCSDAGQESILEQLQHKYSCIRVFHQSINKGVAAARNQIIDHARGEFLAFFDDDDESLPERLETQYERIVAYEKNHAQAAFVICHTARLQYYPDGQQGYEPTMGTKSSPAPNGQAVALRILVGETSQDIFGSAATCSQMARLKTYKKLQGFDEDFRRAEDTEFNVRAALDGAHFVGLAEPLVLQTMTMAPDNKLSTERHYALKLLEKHQNFINKQANYLFCVEWLELKYIFLHKKYLYFMLKISLLDFEASYFDSAKTEMGTA